MFRHLRVRFNHCVSLCLSVEGLNEIRVVVFLSVNGVDVMKTFSIAFALVTSCLKEMLRMYLSVAKTNTSVLMKCIFSQRHFSKLTFIIVNVVVVSWSYYILSFFTFGSY